MLLTQNMHSDKEFYELIFVFVNTKSYTIPVYLRPKLLPRSEAKYE